jgi:hypothetical protein
VTEIDQEWLERRLEPLASKPLAQARLLLCSDDLPAAWRRAAELGKDVEEEYWKEFVPYGRGGDFRLVNEVAERLLQHNRPLAALITLELYLDPPDGSGKPSAELVLKGLEALVSLPKDHKEQVRLPSSYDIQRLLDYLQSANVDEDRLATLEWQLLPARGFQEGSPVLERRLARDPAFFLELMSLCFRRQDGTMEQDVPEGVASNAYRLLNDWKVVPGSNREGGEVDETALVDWTTKVRELAAEQDRSDICDIYIGQVLAHAKEDADDTWPTLPVRNLIEKLTNEKVERGFWTGTYNKRGITTRGPADGGQQEYELADQFDAWAQLIKDRWHRTAAVLRSLAESYRAEGRREDEQAERFKRGLEL